MVCIMDNLLDEELGESKEISYEEMINMLCTISLLVERYRTILRFSSDRVENLEDIIWEHTKSFHPDPSKKNKNTKDISIGILLDDDPTPDGAK